MHAVSHDEWQTFIGAGFNASAFCVAGVRGRTRTCGDGSEDPEGCRWKFDNLDKVYKARTTRPEPIGLDP